MASEPSSWPPATGVTTPKVPREHAIVTASSTIIINAPAAFTFNILIDTSTYPSWCNFIPKADIRAHTSQSTDQPLSPILALHTKFTFHAYMGPGKPSPSSLKFPTYLAVTDISTPSAPTSYVPAGTLAKDPAYTADLQSVYRVAWATDKRGMFDLGPMAERFHEVIVRGEEVCEVRNWECQGGMAAHMVKWLFGTTLNRKFEESLLELKTYGENRWEEEKQKGKTGGA